LSNPGRDSAVDALLQGGVVLLDTDTLPGLHALASLDGASGRIAGVKGHTQQRPYLLLVPSVEAALGLGEPLDPAWASRLARLWPGELTALLRPHPQTPADWTAEGLTVGVRVPAAPALREFLATLPGPLFSTSANRPGEEAARTLDEARASFPAVPVIDLGIDPRQGSSTIVDFTVNPPNLIRPGIVAFET
jgi:tRNA threonylcarbamoyl adenosine modification protein (Sua5/YciO/YrdC/YwlC family)